MGEIQLPVTPDSLVGDVLVPNSWSNTPEGAAVFVQSCLARFLRPPRRTQARFHCTRPLSGATRTSQLELQLGYRRVGNICHHKVMPTRSRRIGSVTPERLMKIAFCQTRAALSFPKRLRSVCTSGRTLWKTCGKTAHVLGQRRRLAVRPQARLAGRSGQVLSNIIGSGMCIQTRVTMHAGMKDPYLDTQLAPC